MDNRLHWLITILLTRDGDTVAGPAGRRLSLVKHSAIDSAAAAVSDDRVASISAISPLRSRHFVVFIVCQRVTSAGSRSCSARNAIVFSLSLSLSLSLSR